MSDHSHRTIKGYELRERVGAGGFGAVYRAYQTAIGREVAVKVILPEHANQPDFVRRFEVEAQLIARLEHPHIVPLYDYWRDPEGAYLVMRWLRGSLRASLERGPWSVEASARLLEQIAGALTVAHREGVIHRDIKPDNILLDEDDNAYLADFGIAKDTNVDSATHEGSIIGSPGYITPEQIKGEPVTPRSDIYSLGLVVYEMLVNEKPYPDAITPYELINRHLNTPLPMIGARRPNLPAAVDEVLQTATAKNPDHRYANVLRFASAFKASIPNMQRTAVQPLAEPLTKRELDILRLMIDGLTNKEIAERLVLSPSTVKWYVQQIYNKLDVNSRHQAVERAQRLNLIGPSSATFVSIINEPPEVRAMTADAAKNQAMPVVAPDLFNPYKGLRAFQEADAASFFGRAALTEQLLTRLTSSGEGARFLAVVGPSGSGKSSVVKAGLIPAIRKGALLNSARWFLTEMMPGAHPLEELEAALLRVSVNPLPGILTQLTEDRRGLLRAVKRTLPTDQDVELILVIDQFEELFTLVEDETVRARFIDNLLSAVTDPRGRVRVILTLRADFYDRPLMYPRLAELVRSHTEAVIPLTASELERAIVGPAEHVGLTFEAGLVATILKDVGEQPGTLPLLQYALSELYERRQDRTLTIAAYQELGGISGALARRADELYESLDESGQSAARQLFMRLITLGEGIEDTRRRTLQAELSSLMADNRAMDDVIDAFSQYRLLTLDRDPITRGPTVEIAHEALIREWGRLRGWLSGSRDALRIQRRLMAATADWIHSGRDAGFLSSGAWLTQFESLAADSEIRLNQEERDHLAASLMAREQQENAERQRQARELELAQEAAKSQRQSANRLRYLVGFLALFLIVAAVLSVLALNSRADAVAKGQLAVDEAATSQANFTRSEAQRLAAESNNLHLQNGNSEVAALLAVRSMSLQYTPQGDQALTNASFFDLPERRFVGADTVAFSPDGKSLLTRGDNNTAVLYDLVTGHLLSTFSGAQASVHRVQFSPDGKRVVVGSQDGELRLYDVSGTLVRAFVGHTALVESVAFSLDGKSIISASDDGTARLWDIASGKQTQTFTSTGIAALTLTPDGTTLIIAAGDEKVHFLDFKTWQDTRQINVGAALYSVGISHDGKMLLTGSDDLIIRLWNVASGTEIREFKGHTNYLRATEFSPDDKLMLSAGDDRTARIWNVQTGEQIRLFAASTDFIWGAAWSPDGNYVATAGQDGLLKLWSMKRNERLFQFNTHTGYVVYAFFSPDGKSILTSSEDQTARLWDVQSGQEIRSFSNPAQMVVSLAFSPDGKKVLTSQVGLPGMLWDVQTGKLLHLLTSPGYAQEDNIAFSPDGRYALVGDGNGDVWLLDVQTWQKVRRFVGHTQQMFAVAFAPDDKTIFTGTYDGTARLWDVATGKQIRQFDIPDESGGNWTTYSPDGKLLAAGTFGGSVYIWDFATGKQIQRLVGHNSQVGVAFSPDGKYLMSSGSEGTIRVWDVSTWQEVRRVATSGTQSLSFSPDGRNILAVTGAKTAELIPVDYHDMIAEMCSRLLRDLSDDERKAYDITDSSPTCPPPDAQAPATAPSPIYYPTPTLPVWTPLAPIPLPTDSATATSVATTESF